MVKNKPRPLLHRDVSDSQWVGRSGDPAELEHRAYTPQPDPLLADLLLHIYIINMFQNNITFTTGMRFYRTAHRDM